MGIIQLKFRGISIKFERPDEEINRLFQQLSGGGVIESHSTQLKISQMEQTTRTPKTLPKNQTNDYHSLSTSEIKEYIKTLPNYKHSVKSIIAHFNDKEIELDRKNELLYAYWFSIRQKQKMLEKQ